MSIRLSDRLGKARHHQFVGRTAELELFQSALAADELPFNVLHVFGPGGVGKTSLVSEFAHRAVEGGIGAYYIDTRAIEPSPEAIDGALRTALELTPSEKPLPVLAAREDKQVVVLDTVETLKPLEGWMQDTFLPSLPENVLLVLSGRNPPPVGWRADSAWQSLIRVLPLRNLSPQESRAFLSRRTVPAEEHQAVLDFTHGHPLALSLVADVFDQRPQVHFHPEAEPDIIRILLEQFAQKAPGPAHRAALEVCSLVRTTTEGLLGEMLHMPDVRELFEWLRGLSFIEASREGLFPHDLAREALIADVRWRNPDWYTTLHDRARTYYMARVGPREAARPPAGSLETPGFAHGRAGDMRPPTGQLNAQAQQRVLMDYIYLHRDNPAVRPFLEWQSGGGLLADSLHDADVPALVAMVEKHEGAESAEQAARWFAAYPRGVTVIRDSDGQPAGFMAQGSLPPTARDELNDPGMAAASLYLQRHAPLRAGETATLFRYWLARDTYQDVSPVQSLIFVNAVRHYLTTPGLAFTLFPAADPDFYAAIFTYADLARIPEADFTAGRRRFGVYGHDWRKVPPMAWLELLGKRELVMEAPTQQTVSEPLIVLSEAAFFDAVQGALRDMARPDALRANPLTRSRLVVERAGAASTTAERAVILQQLLKGAAVALQRSPRDVKLYRALQFTYFEPAPTQEQAAERLDLPFSTYRRHLKSSVTRVAEMLWQQEIGNPERQ